MRFKRKPKADGNALFGEEPTVDDVVDTKHRSTKAKIESFEELAQAEYLFKDPGINSYSERWGAASVNATRMFLIGIVALLIGGAGTFYALKVSSEQKLQVALVEFNGITGEYRKPVKMEEITPTIAMIKFGLAKWGENVFTVDPKMSLNYLKDADAMAKERAKGQFAEFRLTTEVLRHIKEGKKLIFAKADSVDILQEGVAIANIVTTELDPYGRVFDVQHYRARLDYTLNPPTDAALVLRNPIGLEINGFTYEKVAK